MAGVPAQDHEGKAPIVNSSQMLSERVVRALLERERLLLAARLLPGVVHNLSGAVQTLSLPLELLQMTLAQGQDPEWEARMASVQQGLERLLAEVELLSLRGRQDREREPALLELTALADQQLDFWRGDMFFKHQIQLQRDLPAGAPLVKAAYADVALAFNALLANALEAMQAAGRGVLTVRAVQQQGRAGLAVSDSGPGPAAGLGQDIFAPFVGDKSGHDGLGLFLARQALAPYGGELHWRPGALTTFVLSLPLA